ncbi:hypothetical protein G3260_005939 [Streptomyces albus]|uniref:Uncharacterized protein n=1 Tax=Streptomyces albus TaxID=1888 RepID=A0A6C1C8C0_9ACTN|nr:MULTISPECIES: hypothetical protein [Streptomyces]QID39144.1 hypothetical protein G3260_005939 [Streptomyces albus]TGG85643.1 hypothetical protein D8771_10895 [Streptomyces albus]UVN53830.1 hypothetical protein NR995_04265 [Streptomyces albus]
MPAGAMLFGRARHRGGSTSRAPGTPQAGSRALERGRSSPAILDALLDGEPLPDGTRRRRPSPRP